MFLDSFPLISVIVPVYKVELLVEQCIRCLQNQTYPNLEIIVVDDGSPDNSGLICERIAAEDKRISVYHKANGGLSDARNFGVNVATGRYVTFIDSDDYVASNYIEYLFGMIRDTNADISCCGFSRVSSRKHVFETHGELQVFSSDEACMNQISGRFSYGIELIVSWGKLYPLPVLQKTPFPVGLIHEDEATTYKIFSQVNKIAFSTAPLYAYYQNSDGIMAKVIRDQNNSKNEAYIQIMIERAEYYEKLQKKQLAIVARSQTLNYLLDDSVKYNGRCNKDLVALIFKRWRNVEIDKTVVRRIGFYLLMPHIYTWRRKWVYRL